MGVYMGVNGRPAASNPDEKKTEGTPHLYQLTGAVTAGDIWTQLFFYDTAKRERGLFSVELFCSGEWGGADGGSSTTESHMLSSATSTPESGAEWGGFLSNHSSEGLGDIDSLCVPLHESLWASNPINGGRDC